MFKKSLLTTLVLGALCSSAFADDNAAPAVCPSVEAIKAEQLTIADQAARCHQSGSSVNASVTSNFGTDTQWVFTLSGLKVHHKEDATKAANRALKSLKGNPTPAFDEASKTYVCVYAANHGVQAIAQTAPKAEPVNTDPVDTESK